MQTLIIVNTNDITSYEHKKQLRENIMKQMEEGLLVIDDNISITSHNVQGDIGFEFNKEVKNEKE